MTLEIPGAAEVPPEVRDRLLTHLRTRYPQASSEGLHITAATAQDWSDGCLGLGGPAELCLAAITPGWHITVSAGSATWVYRTNSDGTALRQESYINRASDLGLGDLPSALLAHIAQSYPVDINDLRVVDQAQRTWDGCYGVPLPTPTPCIQIAIAGAQFVVQGPDAVWVYHTDQQGREFHLNTVASQLEGATLAPRILPNDAGLSLSNPLPETVLSVIRENQATGQVYQVSVYTDRTLAGYDRTPSGRWAAVDLGQVSYRDWFALRRQLRTTRLDGYHRLHYPAPATADSQADSQIVYTLVLGNGQAMVQYDGAVVDQLPPDLQALIHTWHPLWQGR
jgi:hypothetical protein